MNNQHIISINTSNENNRMPILHSVIFNFKEELNVTEKKIFFDQVKKLISIKGVEDFEILKQVSVKNKFEFGIAMKFKNQEVYEYYNNHPDHVTFVQNFWLKQVEDFLEIDYQNIR